jgi:L-rhamnose-H+ transport protein
MSPYISGVVLHAIGGLAAGSFYAPLKKVRRWSWESSWMVMGVAAWLLAPWVVAWLTIPDLFSVLSDADSEVLCWTFTFGLLWGVGGLTFGLSVRYLGMALGYTVALGACMALGTVGEKLFDGTLIAMFDTSAGQVKLLALAVAIVGTIVCGWAGVRKESDLSKLDTDASSREFQVWKGLGVAMIAGLLSACMAFAFGAGAKIATLAERAGADPLYANNATLVVILAGGFVTNATWCLWLNKRNKTFRDYTSGSVSSRMPAILWSCAAGVIWYGQFFFYGMGKSKLGSDWDFSSWSIHMSFIIVFSNLWGLVFREWRDATPRTKMIVWLGILMLIGSTGIIAYGETLVASAPK